MGSRSIRTFTVLPHLPPRLQALQKLAYNMWWCWNHEAISLFRRIDADLFEAVEHSPVKLLGALEQGRMEQLLHDDGFLAHMDRVEEVLDTYLGATTWFQDTYSPPSRLAASPTSPPSSACMNRCRSTRAAWACWPATISSRPATWAFRCPASA